MRAARRSGGPALVAMLDSMELFQIAEMFGVLDPDDEAQPGPDGQLRSRRAGRNLIAERIRAAEQGLPEPEPDPPSPDMLAFAAQFYRGVGESGGGSG